ncbi:RNA polymerase sigma factor [Fluviicola sp.]|uniref:RNA polymerase sigma factor n=1 Tax=Fluviicola sp. TaxID=1917219 RepID=UPI0031DAD78D
MTLERLYEKYAPQVFNLALQYVQNVHDAEEITQDVFVAVHHSLASFRQDSGHGTWIYRITINKSLDFIKAKKRKKRFSWFTSPLNDYDSVEFAHPGVLMENREETEFIFTCIHALPDNQKTALILNKIEQLSVPQIAEIMNLNAKAVESLIHRGKGNLEKLLNERRS